MEHYIEKCKCGTVIAQCRCPSKDKRMIEKVCKVCTVKNPEKEVTKCDEGISSCCCHHYPACSKGCPTEGKVCEHCRPPEPQPKQAWELLFCKRYGSMFECGDFEQLMDDVRTVVAQARAEATVSENTRIRKLLEQYEYHAKDGKLRQALNEIKERIKFSP
jgi:hypothetical protein